MTNPSNLLPMLAMPLDLDKLESWPRPILYQPKLDGIRCLAVFSDQGKVTMLSRNLKPIVACPTIEKSLNSLMLHDIVLDGELYAKGLGFQEICSLVKRKTPRNNEFIMQYHIFDYFSPLSDDKVFPNQIDRLQGLILLLKHLQNLNSPLEGCLQIVATDKLSSPDEVCQALGQLCSLGYEGIILRKPNAIYEHKRCWSLMKFKPRARDIYIITGFAEEIDKYGTPKGTLGSLELSTPHGEVFNCGSGFDRAQRTELWYIRESLIGMTCLLKYQEATNRGVPRFPIFVEIK